MEEGHIVNIVEREQEIINARRNLAEKHYNAIVNRRSIELKDDQEKGSRTYWDALANFLVGKQSQMEVNVMFGEMAVKAKKIANDLRENGKVLREKVDSFLIGYNGFVSDVQQNPGKYEEAV